MSLASPARACGIDFGTSNSTVGWLRPAAAPLLTLEAGKPTLPSVVFFNADENHVRYGRAGLDEYLDGYEGRLMRALKSLLGSSLIDSHTEVQGVTLKYRELLALFIGDLKRRAEQSAGRGFDTAVFGRPVFFVDDDAEADRAAEQTLGEVARAVGFKEISFQYEPIAAAYHYEQTISREELVLVADIGGGTSDFSLIRISPERAQLAERKDDLLAFGGVHVGGTDFDKYLSLAGAMPLLGYKSLLKRGLEMPSSHYINLSTWHTINFAYTRPVWAELNDLLLDSQSPELLRRLLALIRERAGHWLAIQVEATKIALSQADSAPLDMERIEAGLSHPISRAEFEDATRHLCQRVTDNVGQLLRDAGVAAQGVDTVFFTGGASGVPLLRQSIAALLPQARSVEGDLFGSIGAGLAVDARRRYG